MFDILFIRHDKLTQVLLDEIIKVKSTAWPYNYKEQCEWIKDNLKNSDIHVLLLDGKKVLAYLNLIEIEVNVDSVELDGFGVGNVCAIEKGKGWGKELITHVNKYLSENDKVGLLFCKDKLVKFYRENEWKITCNDQLILSNITSEVNTFVYNISKEFKQIEFNGIIF
ncbi:MAG: hypothetical protein WC389_20395 [Lutibacter sp.]|jgi:hypothetical protein